MGARQSWQRLPADPPTALDALPPELLVQVLSYVPPHALALVTRCRPVCRVWHDVVDGPTLWLLQLGGVPAVRPGALLSLCTAGPQPHL